MYATEARQVQELLGLGSAVSMQEWLHVLESTEKTEKITQWLCYWAGGWPDLAGSSSRSRLWELLLVEESIPWSEELLTELVSRGDRTPSTRAGALVLKHAQSGLGVRRAMGYDATVYSRETLIGDVCRSALGADNDPRSQVALRLARGHRGPVDLLSASVALYKKRFDLILDPALGGGERRMETFLGLREGWRSGPGELVECVIELVG